MSTLLIEELSATPLTQNFTIKSARLNLEHIRPLLYLHNDPAGTFVLSLKQGANVLGSQSLTMAQIKANASFNDNEYHWGFFRFDIGAVLNFGVTYTIELSSIGYAFNESSYLGWIKEHEKLTNSFSESTGDDSANPFGYQLWGYTNG